MGKKRQLQEYDKEAIKIFASELKKMRALPRNRNVPRLNVDIVGLEKAIKELPKKEREALERFWGLIPGTVNHWKYVTNGGKVNKTSENMRRVAFKIMIKLFELEYLYMYDIKAKKVLRGISNKMDKTGAENISKIDCAKYFYLFFVFILPGPNLYINETYEDIDLEIEEKKFFDQFALLYSIWNASGKKLQDRSISLKLLVETVNYFDVKDALTMKRTARLPIARGDEQVESKVLVSLADVRRFKEELFRKGSWIVTSQLIYGIEEGEQALELTGFDKVFDQIRSDINNIDKFMTSQKAPIVTSMGTTLLPLYRVNDLSFTDPDELLCLYLNRHYL